MLLPKVCMAQPPVKEEEGGGNTQAEHLCALPAGLAGSPHLALGFQGVSFFHLVVTAAAATAQMVHLTAGHGCNHSFQRKEEQTPSQF